MIHPDHLLPRQRYPFGLEVEGKVLPAPGARVAALARALVSSPLWREMERAILVVRTEPPEGIAFLGHFSDEEAARVEWLPAQLQSQLPHLRYVSWAQAEDDVAELARRLVDEFGSQAVREMRYAGIPRGGLIVMGMLAYALDLDPGRMSGDPDGGRPLVLVDDCALSGLRSMEFVRAQSNDVDQVILAHLYSHPDLRSAIQEEEPRVLAVVAARDLRDLAPELEGNQLSDWRSRWTRRARGQSYWVGRPEHVAFPWAEPDLGFWDEATGETRAGWRLVPPEGCLKNRGEPGSDPLRLHIQPAGGGGLELAPRTFHGEVEGQVLVAEIGSGQVIALAGVAADLWKAFLGAGSPETALERLATRYGTSAETLRSDAEVFFGELQGRGFIVRAPELNPPPTEGNDDA
jgi:hypothetical protein